MKYCADCEISCALKKATNSALIHNAIFFVFMFTVQIEYLMPMSRDNVLMSSCLGFFAFHTYREIPERLL